MDRAWMWATSCASSWSAPTHNVDTSTLCGHNYAATQQLASAARHRHLSWDRVHIARKNGFKPGIQGNALRYRHIGELDSRLSRCLRPHDRPGGMDQT